MLLGAFRRPRLGSFWEEHQHQEPEHDAKRPRGSEDHPLSSKFEKSAQSGGDAYHVCTCSDQSEVRVRFHANSSLICEVELVSPKLDVKPLGGPS